MCLTPRQYNTTERLNHSVWKTKIIQKQMTEIMEDLDECVSNGKYTDGEYLALSKEIQSEYEKYGQLEKLFMEIRETMKRLEICALERFNGDIDETLSFLCHAPPSICPPTVRARRAKWMGDNRKGLEKGRFRKEHALAELMVVWHGDDVVENELEAGGWERQGWVGEMGAWEFTYELGIQLDGILKNTELYAARREEGHYEVKELFGL